MSCQAGALSLVLPLAQGHPDSLALRRTEKRALAEED